MIMSLSLRPTAARARPPTRPRAAVRSMATPRLAPRPSARPAATRRGHAVARPAAQARSREAVTWEIRTFGVTGAAIAAGFLLALLYLGQMTGVSAHGYEMQRLEAQRDELRRQSALLDVQLAKLDAPARIEAQAVRLGLARVGHVPVMSAAEVAARR